jgi:hypothetical protein
LQCKNLRETASHWISSACSHAHVELGRHMP